MIRYLWDESVSHDVLRALRAVQPEIDAKSIQELGRNGASDDQVIDLSVQTGRVIVTSDRRTLIGIARERIRNGAMLPGVVLTAPAQPPGLAAADLALLADVLRADELTNQFVFLPL